MLPLRISCRDAALYPFVEREVKPLVSNLEQIFKNIILCKVEITSRDNDPTDAYQIAVSLHVPGRQLSVACTNIDLIATLKSAFLTLQRLLKHYFQQLRLHFNDRPVSPPARISFLNKASGFGYITTVDGRELRFDRRHVMNNGFAGLRVGLAVRFIATDAALPQVNLLAPW